MQMDVGWIRKFSLGNQKQPFDFQKERDAWNQEERGWPAAIYCSR
jgi:hypothetical protein